VSHDLLNDPDVRAVLKELARREASRPEPLCPRCARRFVDKRNEHGWCGVCTQEHMAERAAARALIQRRQKQARKSGPVKPVSSICGNCHERFAQQAGPGARRRYCSDACRNEMASRRRRKGAK
jgi:hypothetical protein